MQWLFFPLREKGAVVWDGARQRGLALLLLSSPRFWEMKVLPRGISGNVKRDGEHQESLSLISSKTI